MKLSCVVLIIVCAMTTIAAQANSVQTSTADAAAQASSNTPAQVATEENGTQDGNATAAPSGVWLMTWTNDKGDTRHATLHIQQKGEALNGTANVQGGPKGGTFRLTGNVRGNQIVLSVRVYWHHASFTGSVDGSKMSGSSYDGRPWEATKS
jgi:hypothetical protein